MRSTERCNVFQIIVYVFRPTTLNIFISVLSSFQYEPSKNHFTLLSQHQTADKGRDCLVNMVQRLAAKRQMLSSGVGRDQTD